MTRRDRRSLGILLTMKFLLWAIAVVVLAPTAWDEVRPGATDREQRFESSPEETEPVRVRVHLRSTPPPAEDAQEPPPPSAEATEQPSPPPAVSPAGNAMAVPRGADAGAFPEILADYTATIGFESYLSGLARVGARFFVVRKPAFRLAAEVDPTDLSFMAADRPLDELSPRSREISAEPKLREVVARAALEYGDGDYGVIALLPNSLEQRLMRELSALARTVSVDSFLCEYRFDRDGIALYVLQLRTKDGEIVAVNRSIPLGLGS